MTHCGQHPTWATTPSCAQEQHQRPTSSTEGESAGLRNTPRLLLMEPHVPAPSQRTGAVEAVPIPPTASKHHPRGTGALIPLLCCCVVLKTGQPSSSSSSAPPCCLEVTGITQLRGATPIQSPDPRAGPTICNVTVNQWA